MPALQAQQRREIAALKLLTPYLAGFAQRLRFLRLRLKRLHALYLPWSRVNSGALLCMSSKLASSCICFKEHCWSCTCSHWMVGRC